MCGEKEKGRTDMKEKKRCIHCGAELPGDASFCPVCAQSQVERQKGLPASQAVETAFDDFLNVGHHYRRRRRLRVAAAGAWPAFCKSL